MANRKSFSSFSLSLGNFLAGGLLDELVQSWSRKGEKERLVG